MTLNKDNPLTNFILAIVVIAVLLFAWLIGKSTLKAKEEENKRTTKTTASTIGKNIFYLVVGIILILLFAKLWFAIVGKPD